MKINKGTSWLGGMLALFFIFIITLVVDSSLIEMIGSPIVYSIAFGSFGFQAVNAADNGIKGKWYREELAKKDNG